MGVIWTPSSPSADSAVTVTASGAPGRRIFNVFFCVTVEESSIAGAGATGASVGITESGIRDVWRMDVVGVLIVAAEEPGLIAGGGEIIAAVADLKFIGVIEACDVAPGAARSVGRFRRIVLGATFSCGVIGIDVATPIAESREMRDVFDFAACTEAAI